MSTNPATNYNFPNGLDHASDKREEDSSLARDKSSSLLPLTGGEPFLDLHLDSEGKFDDDNAGKLEINENGTV